MYKSKMLPNNKAHKQAPVDKTKEILYFQGIVE